MSSRPQQRAIWREQHCTQAASVRYSHLFSNVKGQRVDVMRRLYGDHFVVDDKIWTARVDCDFLRIPCRP